MHPARLGLARLPERLRAHSMWSLRRQLANHRKGVGVLRDRTNPAVCKLVPREGHRGSFLEALGTN